MVAYTVIVAVAGFGTFWAPVAILALVAFPGPQRPPAIDVVLALTIPRERVALGVKVAVRDCAVLWDAVDLAGSAEPLRARSG